MVEDTKRFGNTLLLEQQFHFFSDVGKGALELNSKIPVKLSLISLSGQVHWESTHFITHSRVNIADLKPGLYLLKVKSAQCSMIKRLVIQQLCCN